MPRKRKMEKQVVDPTSYDLVVLDGGGFALEGDRLKQGDSVIVEVFNTGGLIQYLHCAWVEDPFNRVCVKFKLDGHGRKFSPVVFLPPFIKIRRADDSASLF